jgi:hypothetical protein
MRFWVSLLQRLQRAAGTAKHEANIGGRQARTRARLQFEAAGTPAPQLTILSVEIDAPETEAIA